LSKIRTRRSFRYEALPAAKQIFGHVPKISTRSLQLNTPAT